MSTRMASFGATATGTGSGAATGPGAVTGSGTATGAGSLVYRTLWSRRRLPCPRTGWSPRRTRWNRRHRWGFPRPCCRRSLSQRLADHLNRGHRCKAVVVAGLAISGVLRPRVGLSGADQGGREGEWCRCSCSGHGSVLGSWRTGGFGCATCYERSGCDALERPARLFEANANAVNGPRNQVFP